MVTPPNWVPSDSLALQTFNLISRHKGTKFPRRLLWGGNASAATCVYVQTSIIMFARGTLIPIFGQQCLFFAPRFGCKVLN